MKIVFPFFLMLLINLPLAAQDKDKALKNVENYIRSKNPEFVKYKRVKFHEFFEQSSPEKFQEELKITTPIKYSLSLTYKLGDSLVDFSYFHLDKDLNVLGVSTKDQMLVPSDLEEKILAMLMNPDKGVPIDSSETVETHKMTAKKFKREVTYEKDGFIFIYDYKLFSENVNSHFLSPHMMFPSDSPYKNMGIQLRKHLDTSRSSSVSINTFLQLMKTEHPEELLYMMMNDIHKTSFTGSKMKVADAKTGTELKNIIVSKKTVRFPKFTRLVTTYKTEEGKLEIDRYQFDDYSAKNDR